MAAWTVNYHPTGPGMDAVEDIHKQQMALSASERVMMVHIKSKLTLGAQ